MEFTKKIDGSLAFFYAWDEKNKTGFEAMHSDLRGYLHSINEPPKHKGEPIDMMEFYKGCVTTQNTMLGAVRHFIIPPLIPHSTDDRTRSPDA